MNRTPPFAVQPVGAGAGVVGTDMVVCDTGVDAVAITVGGVDAGQAAGVPVSAMANP